MGSEFYIVINLKTPDGWEAFGGRKRGHYYKRIISPEIIEFA